MHPAGPDDFDTEFLSLTAAVGVVADADAALAHIAAHGSGHSEAVITADEALGRRFLREVDAAAVYVNASTQFTDGGQFGLGRRGRHFDRQTACARADGSARVDVVQMGDPRRRAHPPRLSRPFQPPR